MARRDEKQVWNDVKKSFPGYAERVESLLADGLPDVHFTQMRLGTGWMELKALERTTAVPPDGRADWTLRGRQAAWHHRYAHGGGFSFVLASHLLGNGEKTWYAIAGCDVLEAFKNRPVPLWRSTTPYPDWYELLTWTRTGGFSNVSRAMAS